MEFRPDYSNYYAEIFLYEAGRYNFFFRFQIIINRFTFESFEYQCYGSAVVRNILILPVRLNLTYMPTDVSMKTASDSDV